MRKIIISFCIGAVSLLMSGQVFADAALLKKKSAQVFIQKMVDKHDFKREEVVAALKEAQFQKKIIQSMNTPYEKKNWDIYSGIFLTDDRLARGIEFWKENQEDLAKAEKKYGVPASMIVSILGVETRYGEKQGNYRVLDALATIAFYYPKRAAYFTSELEQYLLLCREHHVPVTTYVGSYAGAIGQPQFMPSSYRAYAVDFKEGNKPNYPDLVHENKDVIASIANYFSRHGWQEGMSVAYPATVKGKVRKSLQTNSRTANYKYQYLLDAGVKSKTSLKHPPKKAGVIELEKANESHEYWLAYPNFYVIMRYNTSPQYALVVYLLSKQLEKEWAEAKA